MVSIQHQDMVTKETRREADAGTHWKFLKNIHSLRSRKLTMRRNLLNWYNLVSIKGQIVSKWFLVSSISSKKRTKEFNFTTMAPQVDLFSFVFWRKIEDTKKTFRNYLTFSKKLCNQWNSTELRYLQPLQYLTDRQLLQTFISGCQL